MTRTPPNNRHRVPRREPHLTPKRREQIDSSLIAFCYWLIAERIVREAEQHGDLDCPDPGVHPDQLDDQPATDDPDCTSRAGGRS